MMLHFLHRSRDQAFVDLTLCRLSHTSLQSVDESVNVRSQVVRVLSGRLLSTAPARVTEGVDVGRPEVKSSALVVVEGTGFS